MDRNHRNRVLRRDTFPFSESVVVTELHETTRGGIRLLLLLCLQFPKQAIRRLERDLYVGAPEPVDIPATVALHRFGKFGDVPYFLRRASTVGALPKQQRLQASQLDQLNEQIPDDDSIGSRHDIFVNYRTRVAGENPHDSPFKRPDNHLLLRMIRPQSVECAE